MLGVYTVAKVGGSGTGVKRAYYRWNAAAYYESGMLCASSEQAQLHSCTHACKCSHGWQQGGNIKCALFLNRAEDSQEIWNVVEDAGCQLVIEQGMRVCYCPRDSHE